MAGTVLDGCFIGACTTAEEDLIIGAMVLEAAMKAGHVPVKKGRRIVVPGSKPIRHKLEKLGLTKVYEQAGFKIGVPGCSMCVGQGMDQAGEGEVWLSSQNRNFHNRMGVGSIANLGSAATVAASSLKMQICDPQPLLDQIDTDVLSQRLGYNPLSTQPPAASGRIQYSEPSGKGVESGHEISAQIASDAAEESSGALEQSVVDQRQIKGKVVRLGDFIDTDAVSPVRRSVSTSCVNH